MRKQVSLGKEDRAKSRDRDRSPAQTRQWKSVAKKEWRELEHVAEFGRYFQVSKGNNGELVKRILARREGWGEWGGEGIIDFRWTQHSWLQKYQALGREVLSYNHFQHHRELSNKARLVWNMVSFCEANKLNAYSFLPVSFLLDLNTIQEDLTLHSFLKFYSRNMPASLTKPKLQTLILPKPNKYLGYFSPQQLHRRSQGNFYCKPQCYKTFFSSQSQYLWILKPAFLNRGRGIALFENLEELQSLVWKYYEGEGLEDYEEKGYQVSGEEESDPSDPPLDNLSQPQRSSSNQVKGLILAPSPENGPRRDPNQIQRIDIEPMNIQIAPQDRSSSPFYQDAPKDTPIDPKHVFPTSTDSTKKTQEKSQLHKNPEEPQPEELQSGSHIHKTSKPRCTSFIIQKYIERPMLINGKKFDLRVWVLLTQNLEVYYFKESYLRLSSKTYCARSHQDPFIHLTNNSVQKYAQGYDHESGNQMPTKSTLITACSLEAFLKVEDKLKEIIWLSMCSVRRRININGRKDCFELFGYDFMIDQTLKVWLIEVNTNPAIEEASPLLKRLIPRMLDDAFKLTLDKIFQSRIKKDVPQLSIPGYTDQENLWELLGDLRQANYGRRLTFVRR